MSEVSPVGFCRGAEPGRGCLKLNSEVKSWIDDRATATEKRREDIEGFSTTAEQREADLRYVLTKACKKIGHCYFEVPEGPSGGPDAAA